MGERLTAALADTLAALDVAQTDVAGMSPAADGWADAVAWSDELCERAERLRAAILRRYGVAL